jgi:Ca2+-binding RTX toxin-like protein
MASPIKLSSSVFDSSGASAQDQLESLRALIDDLLARIAREAGDDGKAHDGDRDDVISGGEGDDLIKGKSGDDEIDGGEGDDTIYGGSDDDHIDGGEGDDKLYGGSGDDRIDGGEGDDRIRAGSGDDEISGGEGDDRITTGTGADRIVFSGDFANDVITDFNPDLDVIDLTDFADITSIDQLTITQDGDDTVITADGLPGAITVKGVRPDEFLAATNLELACYLQGTRLLTPQGEKAIETLVVGDEVVTASGAVRQVRWLGYRAFDTRFLKQGSRMLPVTIRAGALGPDLPKRDLTVSPGHSVLIDGVFVNADLLIDGATVVRAAPGGTVVYIHVELDSADAVVAEGLASETYLNDGNRRMFANWESYTLRYGEDHVVARLPDGRTAHRYPHADSRTVAAIRARMAAANRQSDVMAA